MRIATWNVNSVRSRLPHLLMFLKQSAPDIALLQETKCTDDAFPAIEIEELGYNLALYGEKSYNGVAILSRFPLEDVLRGLPGDESDEHRRYIEAVANTPGGVIRVASVYVPNGQELGSDKYAYKLRFLERLKHHAAALLKYEERLAIGGDFNIAPFAIDVHEPRAWEQTVLFHPQVRAPLRAMLNTGFYDAFRMMQPEAQTYSWWDYRGNGFAADNGLRIDHLLLSPQAADRCSGCETEKEWRALEKPSDHAPVVAKLA